MRVVHFLLILFMATTVVACSSSDPDLPKNHNHGVYMLIDTSGTYTKQLKKAQQIINIALTKLYPGDSFAVARIDSGSFSEQDIVAKVTFDDRPSVANHQKRMFKETITKFVKTVKPAKYTDITGGILQAVEYLNEKNPRKKTILIFSDLKEDLKEGYVRNVNLKMKGFSVVALNVTKLQSDNYDPQKYLDRLEDWQFKIEGGGGAWKVTNDMDQLEGIFKK